jgi:hypothetical protein
MSRAAGGALLFGDDGDFRAFLELLESAAFRWELGVFAFACLPREIHLVLETPRGGLSQAMRDLFGSFASYHRRRGWKGPVFRSRFKAAVCDRTSYLVELVRLVHRAPLRARLSRDPRSYPWSSHGLYLAGPRRPSWLVVGPALAQLPRPSLEAFEEYVNRPESQALADLFSPYHWPAVVGSPAFKASLAESVEAAPPGLGEEELRAEHCHHHRRSWDEIREPRDAGAREARRVALFAYRRILHWDYRALARHFGITSHSHLSRLLRRPLLPHDLMLLEAIQKKEASTDEVAESEGTPRPTRRLE